MRPAKLRQSFVRFRLGYHHRSFSTAALPFCCCCRCSRKKSS